MVSHAIKPATNPTETPEDSLPSLAEVLDRVSHEGPQIITRGDERFIVLGAQEFATTSSDTEKRTYTDFKDFLFNGPRFDGIELGREPWTMRDIDL
ncbi:MAG: hypothetical protein QM753_16195 [Thermomicrobiales bacterium]